jgi:hypothetical protein
MHDGPQDDGQQGQRQKQLPDRGALHEASVTDLPAAATPFSATEGLGLTSLAKRWIFLTDTAAHGRVRFYRVVSL